MILVLIRFLSVFTLSLTLSQSKPILSLAHSQSLSPIRTVLPYLSRGSTLILIWILL